MEKFYTTIIVFTLLSNFSNAQCFTSISAGSQGHIVAIKLDNTFWTWGSNNGYQMGNQSFVPEYSPIQISTTTNWDYAIAGEENNTFSIRNDNTFWGIGANQYGQLGLGSTLIGLSAFIQIGTSLWKHVSGAAHTYAIQTNGTLWGAGQNDGGQMGNGTCCGNQLTFIQIGTDTNWKQAEASQTRNGIAIKDNGTLWGWGTNSNMLGTSGIQVVNTPTQLGTDTNWEYISVGANHVLGLKTNGELWSFGGNTHGQAGTGFNQHTPRRVGTDLWQYTSAGFHSSFGIKADGTLWAWGRNDLGQLGDGTTIQRDAPIQIGTNTDWVAVAAGRFHGIALKSNGSLWAWGDNQFGQYGNGTTTVSPTAIYIPVEGCTLSIQDFQQIPMVMAPNPAHENVTLYFKNSLQNALLTVYDLTGKKILQQEMTGIDTYQLNIAQYPIGMYILEVTEKGKVIGNYKLMKE